jgi:hypothetical protein
LLLLLLLLLLLVLMFSGYLITKFSSTDIKRRQKS